MRLALLALVLLCGCSSPAPRGPSPAEIAEAEAYADRLLSFDTQAAHVDFSQLDRIESAAGRVNGKPVICARSLSAGGRMLVIGDEQLADVPAAAQHFAVLWELAGC